MGLRIWLNARGVERLESPVDGRADILKADGQEVRIDKEGTNKYAGTDADIMSPSTSVPHVPHSLVKDVTYIGTWHEGMRPDGLYEYRGAKAHVETIEEARGHANIVMVRYQRISIRAGSVSTIRKIYSKIRLAQLDPVERWGDRTSELKKAQQPEAIATH